MTDKLCTQCHIIKPLSEFYKRTLSFDGYQPSCKSCDHHRAAERRRKYPERHRMWCRRWKEANVERKKFTDRRSFLKNKYGITIEGYDIRYDAQNGKCAICKREGKRFTTNGRKDSLEIDHCHNTQEIRGLLCRSCNMGLGLLSDTPEGLHRALQYISGHHNSNTALYRFRVSNCS